MRGSWGTEGYVPVDRDVGKMATKSSHQPSTIFGVEEEKNMKNDKYHRGQPRQPPGYLSTTRQADCR